MKSAHRMRVFVTRRRVPEAIGLLEQHFDVDVWEKASPPDRAVVLQKVTECEGMLTEIDDILDQEVLRASTTLRVVANRAVGMDNVDVGEATRRGIAVANTPGVLQEACADFAFALILAAARNVAFADRQLPWRRLRPHGRGEFIRRWLQEREADLGSTGLRGPLTTGWRLGY